jgi:hypothetical protein
MSLVNAKVSTIPFVLKYFLSSVFHRRLELNYYFEILGRSWVRNREPVGRSWVLESVGRSWVLESVGRSWVLESVGRSWVLESVGRSWVRLEMF